MKNDPITTFLAAIETASIDQAEVYAADAELDATVPNWRFRLHGPDAIRAEYAKWFNEPVTFLALERTPVPGGELVTYEHSGSRAESATVGTTPTTSWCGAAGSSPTPCGAVAAGRSPSSRRWGRSSPRSQVQVGRRRCTSPRRRSGPNQRSAVPCSSDAGHWQGWGKSSTTS